MYKRKPELCADKAWQFVGWTELMKLQKQIPGLPNKITYLDNNGDTAGIITLHGTLTVRKGDWIICNPRNQLIVMDDATFRFLFTEKNAVTDDQEYGQFRAEIAKILLDLIRTNDWDIEQVIEKLSDWRTNYGKAEEATGTAAPARSGGNDGNRDTGAG